jgi:hypothetical protein
MARFPRYVSKAPTYITGDVYEYTVWTGQQYVPSTGECSVLAIRYKILNVIGDSLQVQENSSAKNITYWMKVGDSVIPSSFTPIAHPFGFPQRWHDSLYHAKIQEDTLYSVGPLALFDKQYGLIEGRDYGELGSQEIFITMRNDTAITSSLNTQWIDSLFAWAHGK